MTAELDLTAALPGERNTSVLLRPRYEGSNIGTWIGFKHVNYLIEEAVLDHLREVGVPARELYEEHGLCVELVDLDTRIGSAFHMDDLVVATVAPETTEEDTELRFTVRLAAQREGAPAVGASSKVRVALRCDTRGGPATPAPKSLRRFAVDRIERPAARPLPVPAVAGPYSLGRGATGGDPVLAELTRDSNAFAWRWRIPYPYCHFTERLQMSGYLRQMEEVVDLFLADRGISIKRLLDEQNWIPVVPHSRITLLDEALMEEDLYTVFTVENVFKKFTYVARMDCYVMRDGELLRTATGAITHGYAVIENRRDWSLVDFDERMLTALAD
jgi:acyl-CoA thioesterase FadM